MCRRVCLELALVKLFDITGRFQFLNKTYINELSWICCFGLGVARRHII